MDCEAENRFVSGENEGSGRGGKGSPYLEGLTSPLKNSISDRLFKNDEMQGARILRNEAYNPYVAMTKDVAQHSRSRFSTACYRRHPRACGTPKTKKPPPGSDPAYGGNAYTLGRAQYTTHP